jgi:rod shape-determining protein MreC
MNKLHLILLAAAVVVGFIFLGFSTGRMQAWQSRFLDVSTPALHAGAALSGKISKLNKGLKTLDELETENAALLAENSELRAVNQLRGELEAENRRLRAALDYRERAEFKLLPAQILSRDTDSWWSSVKLNRGFSHGVDTAQPVLTGDGLVGRTTTVAKDISIVLLLTD